MTRILISPDSFKGSLSATEAAESIAAGVRRAIPDAELILVPLADGGEGTVQALVTATGGRILRTPATDPLGKKIESFFGVLGDGVTAVVEMAATSGLPLVPSDQRDPMKATTFGTGELIRAALDTGCAKLILGIGGSATNDGGVGAIQALGGSFRDASGDEVGFGGAHLARIRSIDVSGLDPRIAETEIVVACDVDNPLTGERGASAVFGPQKGATPEMVAELDAGLRNLAEVIRRDLGVDVEHLPGAGAAGGLGAAAVAFLGARLMPGIEIVMEATRFVEKLAGADLVITGEGKIDAQTLGGKAIMGVLRAARAAGVPVLALAGSVEPEGYELLNHGAVAVIPITSAGMPLEEALSRAGELLSDAAEQAMKTFQGVIRNMTSESIWESLAESFDDKLPRRTAIALKPGDNTILYAYPSPLGTVGWRFDDRTSTSYDEIPSYELLVAPWTRPGFVTPLARTSLVVESQEYRPDLVRRVFAYSEPGMRLRESFGRAVEDTFTWRLNCEYLGIHEREKSIFVAFRAFQGLDVQTGDDGRRFDLGGVTLWAEADSWGTFDSLEDAEAAVCEGGLGGRTDGHRYLVLEFKTLLKRNEPRKISIGISFGDPDAARRASEILDLETPIRKRCDSWFESLPSADFAMPEERRAYYKCWWVVKLNYYRSPRFGHMVCEALPVYRGYWLWGLDASEWHSDQNTEYTSVHIRRALDLFLDNQRDDGFITHAIYLTDEVLGAGWSKRNITQTPHIPWVALRYADVTGDYECLRAWYTRLVRFYEYLCESRDACFRDIHLWGIIASFDTGLDTTPAFEKVTYGVDGVKEAFCYPAIYAAERCRYERALARMSEILGTGETEHWLAEAEKTGKAMDEVRWDASRGWYGVLHEDGRLDTRVGIDGLFPFAYGLVGQDKASAAEDNFRRLIGRYGIHTVAPGELEFEADHYWRGPAWPKSCAMGMVAARNYFPDLQEEAVQSTVRMLLRWPSVWECLNAQTGDAARADQGMVCTPVVSSNVGAGEALGALLTVRGVDMMSFDGTLPLAPVRNLHWAGLRLDIEKSDGGWSITARAAEHESGELRVRFGGETRSVVVKAGGNPAKIPV